MEIQTTVYEIISKELGIPLATVQPEVRLRGLPNVDSMRVLQIILAIEKRLGIEIPDDATFRVETVGQFEALIQGICQEAAQP